MAKLLICLCKDDEDVSEAAQLYKSKVDHWYFGARLTGVKTLLKLTRIDEIIVTAHGNEDEMGNESAGVIDVTPKQFAELLTLCNFMGTLYLDICNVYQFVQNVTQLLMCVGIICAVGASAKQSDICMHKMYYQ